MILLICVHIIFFSLSLFVVQDLLRNLLVIDQYEPGDHNFVVDTVDDSIGLACCRMYLYGILKAIDLNLSGIKVLIFPHHSPRPYILSYSDSNLYSYYLYKIFCGRRLAQKTFIPLKVVAVDFESNHTSERPE